MFGKLHVSIILIVNISEVELRWVIKFIVMIKILKKKLRKSTESSRIYVRIKELKFVTNNNIGGSCLIEVNYT